MSPHGVQTPEDPSASDAAWRHQESLLSALRSGVDTDDDPYRDLFVALGEETLPTLPDDFAARVASDAQRLADARAQVLRFKRMLAALLSGLYLPAMLLVAVGYGADVLPVLQNALRHHPELGVWLVASIALAALPASLDMLMRRGIGDAGID
jgi:hypothetical protein